MDSFEIKYNNNENYLEVIYIGKYRNKHWREEYSSLQNLLLFQPLSIIIIDFTSLTWIDPFPLLLLINDLNYQKRNSPQVSIKVILPSIGNKYESSYESSLRIHVFLFNEGIITLLNNLNTILINEIDINLIKESNNYLYYQNSNIIPFTTIDLNKIDTVLLYVETEINNYMYFFKRHIIENNFTETILRIQTTLYELIENVKEHAYDISEDNKFCSYYIRYRKGLSSEDLAYQEKQRLEIAYVQEQIYCPGLKNDYAIGKTGFIELYVVDSGMGLSQHYYKSDDPPSKYPFREAWRSVFRYGITTTKRSNKTAVNGILLLSRVISNGYINAFDGGEIIGDTIPANDEINNFYLSNDKHVSNNVLGFQIMCRISLTAQIKLSQDWQTMNNINIQNSYLFSLNENKDIYTKYYSSTLIELLNNNNKLGIYLSDNRSDKIQQFIDKYSRSSSTSLSSKLIANSLYRNTTNTNTVIILGPWSLFKTQIFHDINSKYGDLKTKTKTIIIGELTKATAIIFESALTGSYFSTVFSTNFESIVLITDKCSIKILKRSNKTYIPVTSSDHNYLKSEILNEFNPDKSLVQYFEFLKSYNSFLIWFYISRLSNRNEYYIKSDIRWYTAYGTYSINGYLNFSKTLSDDFLFKIYEYEYNKILAFCEATNTELFALDTMTEKIINKHSINNTVISTKNKLGLGSVYVTGNTQLSFIEDSIENTFIHFFIYPYLILDSIKIIPHLFHWPRESTFNKFDSYYRNDLRRVGLTSTIAPGGWKYYTLPRYSESGESLTFYDPPKSYKIWQNNEFTKIGHFEYEGYHDMLNFKLIPYFNQSYLTNGVVANYILFRIFSALNILPEDIEDRLLSKSYTEFTILHKINIKYVSVVVYPYHNKTNNIISFLKSKINPKHHNKFIALISYTAASKNIQFTPSYLSIEALTNLANKTNLKSILLFDDVIVDGKTSREIENILKDCGWDQVYKFSLIDRRRLSQINSQYHVYDFIWRLDIPRLGFRNECALCKSLNYIIENSKIFISNICIERISEWNKSWKSIDPESETNNHGINSINIDLISSMKKFSIKVDEEGQTQQIGGNSQRISIYNSYGLMFYIAEITAMSKRDDFVLDIIKNETLTQEVTIELLASVILLYFDSSSTKTKFNIINKLFEVFIKCENSNNHTALASILLIEYNSFLTSEQIINCISNPQDIFKIIELHLDALIAISFISHRNNYNIIMDQKVFSQILHSNLNTKEIYQQFHFQIYNTFGITHNTALQKLCKGDLDYSKNNLMHASACIDKIINLLNQIDLFEVESGLSSLENEFWISKLIYASTECNKEICDCCKLSNEIYKISEHDIKANMFDNITNIFNQFIEIHSYLFYCFETEVNSFIFGDLIKELIANNNEISFSKSFIKPDFGVQKVKWFIFDSSLRTKFNYLVDNKKHSKGIKIQDPFNQTGEEQIMWIGLEANNNSLFINLFNHYDNDLNGVITKFSHKTKQVRLHLEQIGGNVEFIHFSHNILQTKLNIPFIA